MNGLNKRGSNFSENLFSKNNIDQNIVNSIDGANALKLDESYEIKNSEEQNALIDSFESEEESKISEATLSYTRVNNEIPAGVSIESASYMENNSITEKTDVSSKDIRMNEENSIKEEYTPKLFSDDQTKKETESEGTQEENISDQLLIKT